MFKLSFRILTFTQETATLSEVKKLLEDFSTELNLEKESDCFFSAVADTGKLILFYPEMDQPGGKRMNGGVYCDDPGFNAFLWKAIQAIQEELKEWFDDFIYGKVSVPRLQELQKNMKMEYLIIDSGDPFSPSIFPNVLTSDIKFRVLAHEILDHFIKGNGHLFKRIRRCPECGTYFFAEDIRKMFCSTDCKGHNFYKTNRKKK